MASTTTWGIPLVDDAMPIAPIQGLINPIAAALDAGLTSLQTTEHNAVTVAAVGNLPTTGNWIGRCIYVQSVKTIYTWSGSIWYVTSSTNVPVAMSAGTTSISLSSGANYGSAAISFPAGRFAYPPLVTTTINNGPSGSQTLIPRAYNISTAGATVAVYSGSFPSAIGTACTVSITWMAIQMETGASAG